VAENFDQIVVGAGPGGLLAAYEILKSAQEAGKPMKLAVITPQIKFPVPAGTNLVPGLDGMGPEHPQELRDAMFKGVEGIDRIIADNNIKCDRRNGYFLAAPDQASLDTTLDFLQKGYGYKPESWRKTDAPEVEMKGFPASIYTGDIGTLNMGKFLDGVVSAIEEMGGEIHIAQYQGQSRKPGGGFTIRTDAGDFDTAARPILATGAEHMSKMPGLPVPIKPVYSPSITVGPLSEEDFRKVSKDGKPYGFCEAADEQQFAGDVGWGAAIVTDDGKRYVTYGIGESENRADEAQMKENVKAAFEKHWPGLIKADNFQFGWGAMSEAPGMMPLIGRLDDCIVMTGGRGRACALFEYAGQAVADLVVHGDDRKMKLLEDCQPGAFAPKQAPQPQATAPVPLQMAR
jgi:glycine/D-amino acid oxidase-like deaminating enzyme